MARRLRHRRRQQGGEDQGRGAPDHEHRLPAVGRDQPARHQPARRRADGEAAVEGDDGDRAMPGRRELRRQGDEVGQHHPEREAAGEAPGGEGLRVLRGDAGQGDEAQRRRAGDDQPPPPEPVGEGPDRHITDGRAEDAGGEDHAHRRGRDLPRRRDLRTHIGDGVGVVALQHHAEQAEHEEDEVQRPEPGPIDQRPDIDRRMRLSPHPLTSLLRSVVVVRSLTAFRVCEQRFCDSGNPRGRGFDSRVRGRHVTLRSRTIALACISPSPTRPSSPASTPRAGSRARCSTWRLRGRCRRR